MLVNESRTGARLWHRRQVWIAVGAVLLAASALFRITVTDPRIHVRWDERLESTERSALEQRYGLYRSTRVDTATNTWRYRLSDLSPDNIRALLDDPAVDDVEYIDRDTLATEGRQVALDLRFPYTEIFDRPSELVRLHRSLWLLLAGGALLWTAGVPDARRRRGIAIATLLLAGIVMVALPFSPAFVTMGGSADHVISREEFEDWWGGRVRFEKHLSHVALLQVYEQLEPTDTAPARAVVTMTRLATAWFVLSALAIGALESWSPLVLRYLGLALLAPSALLYFGWRELGYLSLNVATFPLLVRGLRGGARLEAGSALAGLGAALHGSGVVSLAGAGLMAVAAAGGRLRDRADRVLRVIAWGTAAYVGWVALYLIVLELPITPDPGAMAFSPWRPLFVDDMREGRVAAAIVSATGARDVLMSAWLAGALLVPVALSSWRRHRFEARAAAWYLVPSVLFLIFRWVFDGPGRGFDLVAAGFPAFYGLAWVCAHDASRTRVAAALLVSAQYAFWWAALDDLFVP